jgi:hypothetical protein
MRSSFGVPCCQLRVWQIVVFNNNMDFAGGTQYAARSSSMDGQRCANAI